MCLLICLHNKDQNVEFRNEKPCPDVNAESKSAHFFEILLHSMTQPQPDHKDQHAFGLPSAAAYIVKLEDPSECDKH